MYLGFVKPIPIGVDGFSASHIQYADDTILFGEASLDNLLDLRRVVRCFQLYLWLEN